jgi:DNA-binding IclR family transcriptional regulator
VKPGQLDGLVLSYLKKNADSGPHGPTAVAKALNRSSGATSNCLTRLTNAKQVRQDSEKPRRYSLAA